MSDLDSPITFEELNKTIKLLPSGKTPGVDGKPGEFYETFAGEISPELLKTFNAAIPTGQLPPSMTDQ